MSDELSLLVGDLVSSLEETSLQESPVEWAEKKLGIQLWEKQKEICEAIKQYPEVYVASAFGIGKSFTAALLTAWWVDTFGTEGKVVTTAPTSHQVYGILWQEINKLARIAKLPGKILRQAWNLGDPGKEWYTAAFGRSPQDYRPTAFQGIHQKHVLVIMDEAPGVSPQIWEAARGLLTSSYCRFLAIGNPIEPTGIFYEGFVDTKIRPGLRKTFQINAFQTPNVAKHIHYTEPPWEDDTTLTEWKYDMMAQLESVLDIDPLQQQFPGLVQPRWIYDQLSEYDLRNPFIQSKVFGMFPQFETDTVIPLRWVELAKQRWEQWTQEDSELRKKLTDVPAEIGVDPARQGGNEAVISVKIGNVIARQWHYTKLDHVFLQGKIRDAVNWCEQIGHRVKNIRIDEPGMGGPLIDFMRASDPPFPKIIAVSTGLPARQKDRYFNLRSEMWFIARQMLDPNSPNALILPPDEKLCKQLCSLKYTYTTKQQWQVETKKDALKRGITDLGRADALILSLEDANTLPNLGSYAFNKIKTVSPDFVHSIYGR